MRLLILGVVLLVACGDDDGGMDGGVDAMVDTGVDAFDAAVEEDAGFDAGPRDCASILTATSPFAVAPDFRRTQIHPAAVFDGETIWMALTVVDDPGPPNACVGDDTSTCEPGQNCVDDVCRFSGFDIAVTSVECDGTPGTPSIVSAVTPPNDIDASIALGSDGLLVAWQRDEGTGMIGTVTRAMGFDGAPLTDETPYTSLRGGEPVTGTVWFPSLLARAEGGFWLYGTRGIEEVSAFQAYLQELDDDGAAVGEGSDVFFVDADQAGPEVVVDGADTHIAWTQDDQAVYLAPGASDPVTLLEGFVATTLGGLARQDGRTLALISAGTASATINLLDAADPDGAAELARGRVASPFLAMGESGSGAVLWLADTSGFVANQMFVRRYDYDGTTFTLGDPVEINTLGSVGIPYRPSILYLREGFYFVSWAEREGDRWDVFGQIVAL